jgi:hypothetical protein
MTRSTVTFCRANHSTARVKKERADSLRSSARMSTYANRVEDMAGPFRTLSFNFGWHLRVFSAQLQWGLNSAGDPIVIFNYGGPGTIGVGYGASVSLYDTNTWTQKLEDAP